MDTPNASFAEAPDAERYPDLVEHGTLAQALQSVADERGLDLGEIRPGLQGIDLYRTATLASSRGTIVIRAALNRRSFSVSVGEKREGVGWAWGGAPSLEGVAQAAAAWRGGISLASLLERYPFMKSSRYARGFASGAPVETEWEGILEEDLLHDDYAPYREMVAVLHSDPRLRRLFPFFSHFTFRLRLDPYNQEAGGIHVDRQEDGRYSVRSKIDGPSYGTQLNDIDLTGLVDAVTSLL